MKATPRNLSADLVTSSEASDFLKVKEGTLRYWRSTQQGPAWFKIGPRRIAYLRSDLDRWLETQHEQSYTDPARAG